MASYNGRIAIVGMACRLPGGAHSPDEFWNLLLNGQCTMEDIPSSRFNIEDYWSKNPGDPNRMGARKGHFLREGMLFDEAFFNMSPREAANTDPQHRVLLETVVDAMDDAGYKASINGGEKGWDRSKIGVFIGSAGDSYQNNLTSQPIDAFFSTGTIRGFASGRISHHFGWQGPSIVYDTACSSSLVAVHAACQSLLLHECNAAVASATNMCTSPEMYIALSKGFFISNTEGCRTFDETADGYCRGEGAGVVVLKRLEDALRDKDLIHAIIVASGVNQSGLSESLTTPHPAIQAALFVDNCKRANIPPLSVCAVEAHGTGTQAGDYGEMEAIKMAYCDGRKSLPETKLFVASVKPNIGHSESAAGLSSLIKAVLMTKHRKILPHIGVITRRNPRLGNLEDVGIVLPTAPQVLAPVNGDQNIFIAVHSFGAPGGNASVIIQDTPVLSKHDHEFTSDPRTHHVIALSAKPHTPLSNIIQLLLDHLNNAGPVSLSSLSYTTTARREDFSSRIALSVSSVQDLKDKLQDELQACFTREADSPSTTIPRVGFLIGGNGSQFQGMGEMLYKTSPVFRKHIAACSIIAQELGVNGLIDLITGVIDPLLNDPASELVSAVGIVSVGYALGKMWMDWGVKPALLLGHSLGEYVGLALAGCISLADAMTLVVTKIKAVHASSHYPNGGMLAVGLSPHDTKELISLSSCRELEVACVNGTSQTVVAGARSELLKLQSFIQSMPQPPLIKLLSGCVAWHSSHLAEPALTLKNAAESVELNPAKVPMLLNVDGTVLQQGEILPSEYFRQQMVMSVLFDKCANHPAAQGIDIWIELSAKTVLIPLLRPCVPSRTRLLPTLGGMETHCWSSITKALAHLYTSHIPINWAEFHRPYPVGLIPLPSYPFARNEHWVQYTDHLSPRQPQPITNISPVSEFIPTPLGLLQVKEPWKHYILHHTGAKHQLRQTDLIWLIFSCTQSTHIINLEFTDEIPADSFLEMTVESGIAEESFVSFHCGYYTSQTSGKGHLITKCQIAGGLIQDDVKLPESQLTYQSASSYLSRRTLLQLLQLRGRLVETFTALESLAISHDGNEAVGQIAPNDEEGGNGYHGFSNLTMNPSQISAFFQAASILMVLESGSTVLQRIDQVRLMNMSANQSLSAHIFLETRNGHTEVAEISVYSSDGLPILSISGLHSGHKHPTFPKHASELRIQANISYDSRQRRDAETLISPSVSILTSSTRVEERVRPAPELVPAPTSPQPPKALDDKPVPAVTSTPVNIISVLAQELGVPEHTVRRDDLLDEVGVDSIMWLLLRDRLFSPRDHTCSCEWPIWHRGQTVQDLSNLVQIHAGGVCHADAGSD